MGFTGRAGSLLSFTVDGYYIHIKNRIVPTGTFADDDQIGGTLRALNVGQAQCFANVNRLLVVGNAKTTPRLQGKEEDCFGLRERAFAKAPAPPCKVNLTFDYSLGRFGALARLVQFGPVRLYDYADQVNDCYARLTTDLALSYVLTNQLRLSVGASNLFDVYPKFFNPQLTENGGAWDAVQMGSNGRFLFAKLQFRVSK